MTNYNERLDAERKLADIADWVRRGLELDCETSKQRALEMIEHTLKNESGQV